MFRSKIKGDVKISKVNRKSIPEKFSGIDSQMILSTCHRKINKSVFTYDTRYFYYINTDFYEDISNMLIFDIIDDIKPLIREAKINGILN